MSNALPRRLACAAPLTALLFSCATAHSPVVPPAVTTVQTPPAPPPVVARVGETTLDEAALAAHQDATKLTRAEALEDLIDLTLLRKAATSAHVALPASAWSADDRARVEYEVAVALEVPVPPMKEQLTVDHAWVKDAATAKARTAQRTLMERLRTLVAAGATIPAAFAQLKPPADGWHIGDHEQYLASVVPVEARGLAPGSLSAIIPGDSGLHLFWLVSRTQQRPPADEVSGPLRERLREGATIERPQASGNMSPATDAGP